MEQTVDLTDYEIGIQELVKKLKFPPAPGGQEMSDEQKKGMILQFLSFALMS